MLKFLFRRAKVFSRELNFFFLRWAYTDGALYTTTIICFCTFTAHTTCLKESRVRLQPYVFSVRNARKMAYWMSNVCCINQQFGGTFWTGDFFHTKKWTIFHLNRKISTVFWEFSVENSDFFDVHFSITFEFNLNIEIVSSFTIDSLCVRQIKPWNWAYLLASRSFDA